MDGLLLIAFSGPRERDRARSDTVWMADGGREDRLPLRPGRELGSFAERVGE
jgi:hypothetical protein